MGQNLGNMIVRMGRLGRYYNVRKIIVIGPSRHVRQVRLQ